VDAVGLNEDEMVLIIKRFKTVLKGRKEYPNKNKTRGKRSCFKCGKTGHLLLNVLIMKMTRHKKVMGRRRRRRITGRQRARRILEKNGILTALHPSPTMKDWLPRPSTSLHSSPTNIIHVLWLRRRRYVFEILLSTLLLVMRNPLMMK
jgi:hypothetical protein